MGKFGASRSQAARLVQLRRAGARPGEEKLCQGQASAASAHRLCNSRAACTDDTARPAPGIPLGKYQPLLSTSDTRPGPGQPNNNQDIKLIFFLKFFQQSLKHKDYSHGAFHTKHEFRLIFYDVAGIYSVVTYFYIFPC